jgi:hypothetical protein
MGKEIGASWLRHSPGLPDGQYGLGGGYEELTQYCPYSHQKMPRCSIRLPDPLQKASAGLR